MVLDGSKADIFIGGNLPSPTKEHMANLVTFLVVATGGVLRRLEGRGLLAT